MWYKDWFADENYLALYEHRNDAEAAKLLDIIERVVHPSHDARILDLACGAGRHSIALALRGYSNVTGVDLSMTLINRAIEIANQQKVDVKFVQSDMREFEGEYDLILNLFTSFGYFESDTDSQEVLLRVSKSLTMGGYFVLDFLNATYVEATLVPHSSSELSSGDQVEQFREIRNHRVEKKIFIRTSTAVKEYRESVRLFNVTELEAMIRAAGLMIVKIIGNYDGEVFDEGSSPRLIIVAKKDA